MDKGLEVGLDFWLYFFNGSEFFDRFFSPHPVNVLLRVDFAAF
jgi:hypothetical protein